MKKKTGKMFLLTGMLCILSLAVCACGKREDVSDSQEQQVVQGELISEDDTEDDISASESVAGPEGTETENEPEEIEALPKLQSGKGSNQGADGAQKEQPETQSTSAKWAGSTPNLEGSVKELGDGKLTVVEAIQEKSENGGDIMVLPGNGDDSGFNKVSVTYNENTLFGIQKIYDGGARFEMSEATAADLALDQHIQVWGSFSDSGLEATEICMVKVE